MKKTIILSAAMAFATFGAFAQQTQTTGTTATKDVKGQPHGSVDERAKRQTDKINASVQLTADQYPKVLEIIKSFVTQRDAVRTSTPAEDQKTKFKALAQQEETQLKTVLTPEQLKKLEAERKERQGNAPAK